VIKRIREIVIAVSDLDKAVERYSKVFHLQPAIEVFEEEDIKACSFTLGETDLYLISPLKPDTAVDKFINERGAGVFGISIEVTDIERDLAELETGGVEVSFREPRVVARTGERYVWTRPRSMHGVAFEFAQFPSG